MATFGSSTAPSFAGWDWPGSGYAFASEWTSPSEEILATEISAYFDTVNGNQAHGWCCIWDSSGPIIVAVEISGFIPNGSQSAGGQAWHTVTIPNGGLAIAASQVLWIGGYCTQGTLFSTYDTTPQAHIKSMGGTVGSFSSPTNTGQGTSGGYVTYSILKNGAANVGNDGGGLTSTANIITPTGSNHVGSNGGGLKVPNTFVLANVTTFVGGSGGLVPTASIIVSQIKIWRV